MYGIIATHETLSSIKDAIGTDSIYFESVGKFDSETFIKNCTAAANVNIQTLIIEMACTDDQSIIKGIQKYRLNRQSRIVIIAPGRKPGDITINTLFKFAVFDFVAPEIIEEEEHDPESEDEENEDQSEEIPLAFYIEQQLKQEPSYAMAARWDTGNYDFKAEQPSKPKKQLRIPKLGKEPDTSPGRSKEREELDEEVINQILSLNANGEQDLQGDRIIGTVIVAVIGVEPVAGTTHTSILIANYLERAGKKIAILEANEHEHFAAIANAYDGLPNFENKEQVFKIEGVDYYKSNYHYDIAELLEQEYDYIIFDLGDHNEHTHLEEFYRAHVHVVVGYGSEWRQSAIYDFNDEHDHRDQSNWIYCIPSADPIAVSDIQKEVQGSVYGIPHHPDPYRVNKETDAVIQSFMKDYMGNRLRKRNVSSQRMIIGFLVLAVLLLLLALYFK